MELFISSSLDIIGIQLDCSIPSPRKYVLHRRGAISTALNAGHRPHILFFIFNCPFPVFLGSICQLELDATAHRTVLVIDFSQNRQRCNAGASKQQKSWRKLGRARSEYVVVKFVILIISLYRAFGGSIFGSVWSLSV